MAKLDDAPPTIATLQGRRSAAAIVDELFMIARAERDAAAGDHGYALVDGGYLGEVIEIRVCVKWRPKHERG